MKIKTSDLIGHQLAWAVAVCEGREDPLYRYGAEPGDKDYDPNEDYSTYFYISGPARMGPYNPHIDWSQGGPIIEREGIWVKERYAGVWDAFKVVPYNPRWKGNMVITGPTYLSAAMRCYVASKLGNEVDIPKELI